MCACSSRTWRTCWEWPGRDRRGMEMSQTLHGTAPARTGPQVRPHHPGLPLRVGTRGSPLALVQTRAFLTLLTRFCPVLRGMDVFQEHAIRTTGDATQATGERLADIGGKGLFAKEIHEALLGRRDRLPPASLEGPGNEA